MKMPLIIGYVRRFGLIRGFEFYRVARTCDQDPHLLASWATHFRSRASREFLHGRSHEGHVFQAFAEILTTTYDSLVLKKKKLRRPILSQRQQRLERHLNRIMNHKA